jgi:hypothetical protein
MAQARVLAQHAIHIQHLELTTRVVGSPFSSSSIDQICARVGGIKLNSYHCAVRGQWTQLSTEVGGFNFSSSSARICEKVNGITFGGINSTAL